MHACCLQAPIMLHLKCLGLVGCQKGAGSAKAMAATRASANQHTRQHTRRSRSGDPTEPYAPSAQTACGSFASKLMMSAHKCLCIKCCCPHSPTAGEPRTAHAYNPTSCQQTSRRDLAPDKATAQEADGWPCMHNHCPQQGAFAAAPQPTRPMQLAVTISCAATAPDMLHLQGG